jgi:Amt family ammonium transporter
MKSMLALTRPWGLLAFLLVGLLCASLTLVSVAQAEDTADPGTEAAVTADASGGSGDETSPQDPEEKRKEEIAEKEEAAEEEETATPFAEMSTDEKFGALAGAALVINEKTGVVESTVYSDADTLWTCLAAFLVFFMQAGFALVECGFTRAKNACNIIMKNVMDFSLGSLSFWLVGFGLMFGVAYNGFIGTDGFMFDGGDVSFNWAFLIFQTVFAATAATIVSGAMAERTKFVGYLCYSVAITIIVYPIFGKWAWGSLLLKDPAAGWLEGIGFIDFAGSTVVHSVGGWCALAGAIVIGPRIGKFGKNGRVNPIPGHNIPLAALGVFILWLGWFGFNPGSTTAVGSGSFAKICVTTNLAAAAGAVGAMITSWILFKKPDPSFTLNGALAGLVAITAGCANLSAPFAALTGLAGGMIVVLSVVAIDRCRVDDPVGAVSVHGVCGAWGTLAVGLFDPAGGLVFGNGVELTLIQLAGVGAAFAWAFPVSLVIFLAIKYTVGLRVSKQEELEGLDISEHGMHAYPPSLVAEGTEGISPTYAPSKPASPAPVPSAEGA